MTNLEKEKDKYATHVFWFGLQTSLIFGIPAIAGAIVGRKMDAMFNTNLFTIGILAITFIGSWIIVLVEYGRLKKELKNIIKMSGSSKKEEEIKK